MNPYHTIGLVLIVLSMIYLLGMAVVFAILWLGRSKRQGQPEPTPDASCNTCSAKPHTPVKVRFWRLFFPIVQDQPTDHLRMKFNAGLTTEFVVKLDWKDRVRILFGGIIYAKIVTGCKVAPEEVMSVTTTQILHKRDPYRPARCVPNVKR